MEADEPRIRGGAIQPLVDDLSLFSETDLEARMAVLAAEIERCRDMLDAKRGARSTAESLFKTG